jgi:predicted ATPase
MSSKRNRLIKMPAPYLRRIWLEPSRIEDRAAYPFCLPLLRDDFELSFDRAITIIVGENGTSKSTLGSPSSPAMTRPAAARGIGLSIIPTRSK